MLEGSSIEVCSSVTMRGCVIRKVSVSNAEIIVALQFTTVP